MPKLQVDKALIHELSRLLDETNLTEIELWEGSKSVRVSRAASAAVAVPAAAAAAPAPAAGASAPAHPGSNGAEGADEAGAVRSPMVGTVYLAPEPDAPPFVKVGDRVAAGQTLLIIEAMKVMNHIPAPRAGTVTKILAQDAQPTEYGDILVVIA
jgi:acetyl-CoA carboxylase biotin carboxyl carrier protein